MKFSYLVSLIHLISIVLFSSNYELVEDLFTRINKIIIRAPKMHYEFFYKNYISKICANDISIATDFIENINITYQLKQKDGTYSVDLRISYLIISKYQV